MTGVKRDSWADKLIREDQKERTDGTMGKKTVYTSEADVKAIENGSLYLGDDGHAIMRIPEGSAEQLSVNNKNKIYIFFSLLYIFPMSLISPLHFL